MGELPEGGGSLGEGSGGREEGVCGVHLVCVCVCVVYMVGVRVTCVVRVRPDGRAGIGQCGRVGEGSARNARTARSGDAPLFTV